MKRSKCVAEHIRNVLRCALRSSTAGSGPLELEQAMVDKKERKDMTRRNVVGTVYF